MSRIPYVTENVIDFSTDINESLRVADGLITSRVSAIATAPPGSPAQGERVAVATGATGAFAGRAGQLAVYEEVGAFWQFHSPVMCAYNNQLYISNGTDWVLT